MKKLLAILILSIITSKSYDVLTRYKTPFTHNLINKINPAITIDFGTLSTIKGPDNIIKELNMFLIENNMMKCNLLRCMFNPDPNKKSLNIIIESNGGYAEVALEVSNILNSLRKEGIIISCYTNKAQSAAFFLLITACDKRIGVGGVKLMQHKSYYYSDHKIITSGTLKNDILLSNKEADLLGVNRNDWIKLTRGSEDHIFTKYEIKKYKLIDKYIETTL